MSNIYRQRRFHFVNLIFIAGSQVTITLRHLITHMSGIRTTNEADLMHDFEFRITNSTQTVAFFANDPLLFKPGSKFYYSNSGWNLIGAIVEAVENKSYDHIIREYMDKLGMKHSLMDTRLELVRHRASNYRVGKIIIFLHSYLRLTCSTIGG